MEAATLTEKAWNEQNQVEMRDEARAAEYAGQIGPVITTAEAELRALENARGCEQDQARYDAMDWAPTA